MQQYRHGNWEPLRLHEPRILDHFLPRQKKLRLLRRHMLETVLLYSKNVTPKIEYVQVPFVDRCTPVRKS